ncbi:hypothetical protein ANCDUO_13169 [Ancylostoma duodenale]|uniref:Uncharacterized protein n=1 Tax=Ancylostoma duodenale TaxID=51022 RepID=A0A0C2CJL2_9BILA|nr:hypothetical protein ANCDUO_13169 [Ancylostoma duodenale]
MTGHYKETPNITDITLPWLLFSNGAFEIFGEADDEDKAGRGHYKETPNITDITLPWLLFSNGAFEIFGEADDEDKAGRGNVSDCTQANFNWDDITETSVQCWFKVCGTIDI